MDWYDVTGKYHEMTFEADCDLESLPEEWQRELAALWRLEADVNNGGYLQFLANWGTDTHHYALAALQKIGAVTMAGIILDCHIALSSVVNVAELQPEQLDALMPNPTIGPDGQILKQAGSTLPESVLETLYDLSYNFMDYPDDLPELGLTYYKPFLASEHS